MIKDNDMNYFQNVGRLFIRALLFPVRHVVLPRGLLTPLTK